MDPQALAGDLRAQLRARPYATLIGAAGVGWMLGRSFSLRAWVALAGIGARSAVARALEGAVRERFGVGR
jgi:hypothetical protein